MPTRSQSVQHDHTVTQTEKYAVYEPAEGVICHHDDGPAISDDQNEAVAHKSAVADRMGLSADRLEIVRLTVTPVDTPPEGDVGDDPTAGDADLTTGSIMVTRGPHRSNPALVEYREAEDGAWAVKTPEDEEFWIFMRSGTERDVHQHIRAKWDASYSNPDPFTDQSCPTRDL